MTDESECRLARECRSGKPERTGRRVGLDGIDRAALVTIPRQVLDGGVQPLLNATTAIAEAGARSGAMVRLLARDLQLQRAALRFREAACNLETERFLNGGGDPRRLEVAERLVAGAHRRMLDSIEMMWRIDGGHTAPRIKINAGAAQFNVRTN